MRCQAGRSTPAARIERLCQFVSKHDPEVHRLIVGEGLASSPLSSLQLSGAGLDSIRSLMPNAAAPADPDALQHEIESLAAARADRERVSGQVRRLEEDRAALEKAIGRADTETSEEELDAALRRLATVERCIAECRGYLGSLPELDARYADALARQHALRVERDPEEAARAAHHAATQAQTLFAAELEVLDTALRHALEAERHLAALTGDLRQAARSNWADLWYPLGLLDLVLTFSKYARMASAREHCARARSALYCLEQTVEVNFAKARAQDPLPVPLGTFDAAVLDVLLDSADLFVGLKLMVWRDSVDDLASHVRLVARALEKRRTEVRRALAESPHFAG